MKIHSDNFFVIAALLGLTLAASWWFSRLPASKDKSLNESLVRTQSLVTDSHVKPGPNSSPTKVKLPPSSGPVSTTMDLPPEDLDETREWTRQNQSAAMAWLMNSLPGEQRDAVVEIVCAKVAESDPAQAVALAERFSGGNLNLMENLVQQWAERNEPAASTYAILQPEGEERDRLISRVAFAQSRQNPAEAAKLVAEQIAPGEVQNEAAISVLHQWALRDPQGAQLWERLFPAESIRERAMQEVRSALR